MFRRKSSLTWRLVAVWVVCATLGVLPTHKSAAQQTSQLSETALALAPEDAAFFGTSLNIADAWEEFMHGNFVTRLRAVPFVQELETEFSTQWDNPQGPLAQAKATLNNPNVQSVLQLVQEMGSREIFIYGDDNWCEMIDSLMDFQNEMTSRMSAGPEAIEAYFENLQPSDVEDIEVPTTVIGFRLDDDENARLQLDALEGFLRIIGGQFPPAKPLLQRLKRADLQDGQTLAISLDTSLIPLDMLDDKQRQFAERINELFEGRSLSLAIGVKSNMALVVFGEDATIINTIGENDSSLLDNPHMELLMEQDMSRLRSISYASERWRESQWNANFGSYFQRLAAQLSFALENEEEAIPDLEQWQAALESDAEWLDEEIAELAPEFGETLAWSATTDEGTEAFVYDWSENKLLQNAAPLRILEHAGSSPLMLVGLKQLNTPGLQRLCEQVLDKLPDHIRRFIEVAEEDEDDRERALQILNEAWPLVEDAHAIFSDKIFGAFDEHETVFAMSALWTTSDLGENLPPPDGPLPVPELGVACTLANRELFLNGCEELYGVFDRVVDLIRKFEPDSVPDGYRVPRPDEQAIAGGTRYYYQQFADAVPLDGFNPQVIVTDDLLIMGYSQRQVDDMASAKPLRARPAWLTPQTPVAAVSYVDMAGMVRAVRPWIEMGLSMANPDLDAPLADEPGPIPSGNDILQIWDCFTSAGKAAGTVTVSDDGPTITRWVVVPQ